MPVDFTPMLPTILVGLIAFLIRQSFKGFGEKLDSVVQDVKDHREITEAHGNRITEVETILEEWRPALRRKTDT